MIDKNTRALLPNTMVSAMDAITGLTNAPDEMTLPVVLAAANFAAQGLADAECLIWEKCAISEYFVVLAPSGVMKTGVNEMALKGLRTFENEQAIIADSAMQTYRINLKKYQREVDDYVKTGGLVEPVEPVKPKGNRYTVEKATVNGLINTLERVPFAGLFSSDAGEFFNSHSFQDKNKSTEMISTLSKAWSGERITRETGIEDNNVTLRDRRFSMIVLIQQQLAGFLNDKTMQQQGFTHRLLVSQSNGFSKKIPDLTNSGIAAVKKLQDQLTPFNDRIYDMLEEVDTNQQKARTFIPAALTSWSEQKNYAALQIKPVNELILPILSVCRLDNSRKLLQDFYIKMISVVGVDYEAEFVSFYNRAYEHVIRLAATLSLYAGEKEMNERYIACAINLVEYFIQQRHNLEVEREVKENPIIAKCENFLRWLAKRQNKECNKQEFHNAPVMRKLSYDDRIILLEELVNLGKVITGGSPMIVKLA